MTVGLEFFAIGNLLNFADQAFGKRSQFTVRAVCFPCDATVLEHTKNRSTQRTAQRLDAVAPLPIGGFAKRINDPGHRFPWQHSGDVMGNGRHDFAASARRQVSQYHVNEGAANIGKRVAVEKEKRGAAMTSPQEFYDFSEGSDFGLALPPLCFNRRMAL